MLALAPESDLWLESAGAGDTYGFEHLFLQKVRVELRLLDGAVPISTATTALDVCDTRRLGSLYDRIVEQLVKTDAERQASAAGVDNPGHAYHPWFPVLLIGSDKAALYTRALVADIVDKDRYLAEPGWLLRVGVYLELLTALGIVEAVRDEVGDLLSPSERAAFEGDAFAPIRERVDPEAWRGVWGLREIAFPRRGIPHAGPVSMTNLLRKKRTTLKFLHVHHEDLKQAIELAGPNHTNAQESWQRVFRDAERAVLRKTSAAFPELGYLPAPARDWVLWHRKGQLGVASIRVPKAISMVMADQDGLFPAACNEYRKSMNTVAEWARQRSLMNPAGMECVARRVSLVEAYLEHPEYIEILQQRDGYLESLDICEAVDAARPVEDAATVLASVPIFSMLDREDLRLLAQTARPMTLGPYERFVVQGAEGTSLFVVADGEVEVVLRRSHGPDMHVDTMGRGEVVGEMSLLTGEARSATVRAVDAALVFEIGQQQYGVLLRAHPEWIDTLADIMEERLRDRYAALDAYDARGRSGEIAQRIARQFFGAAQGAAVGRAAPAE